MSMCRDKEIKEKYRHEIPQILICRDGQNKVKYIELKYFRCQYAKTTKTN